MKTIITMLNIIYKDNFYMTESTKTFRVYESNTKISEQYKKMRQNQTLEYAKRMKRENITRLKENGIKMKVIDCVHKLNDFIDNSDPDISLSNVHHLYQTAEAIRKDGHPDWLQLVGLIHDLGKIMFLWGNDNDGTSCSTQWGTVGDTYILGCRLRNNEVYPEFDQLCPDMNDEIMSTNNGIYFDKCGLLNCVFTWGHDEYLYDTLKYNKNIGNVSELFPEEAYLMIRFHSFYPWHKNNEYSNFETDSDTTSKKFVELFNKYDLYTKTDDEVNIEELCTYYEGIINKYFKNGILIF